MSCASGKHKHGRARACAPQRSTLKEHVPRPGRSLFVAFGGGGASQYFSMSCAPGVVTSEEEEEEAIHLKFPTSKNSMAHGVTKRRVIFIYLYSVNKLVLQYTRLCSRLENRLSVDS